jgi:hypothetical protein
MKATVTSTKTLFCLLSLSAKKKIYVKCTEDYIIDIYELVQDGDWNIRAIEGIRWQNATYQGDAFEVFTFDQFGDLAEAISQMEAKE